MTPQIKVVLNNTNVKRGLSVLQTWWLIQLNYYFKKEAIYYLQYQNVVQKESSREQ
jgi:hypothetical protein